MSEPRQGLSTRPVTRRGCRVLLCGVMSALLAFPTAGIAAECEGDECQAPPPPPAEVIPATSVVEGPGNPPVHFEGEKPKPKKPGHKHHRRPTHKKPAH